MTSSGRSRYRLVCWISCTRKTFNKKLVFGIKKCFSEWKQSSKQCIPHSMPTIFRLLLHLCTLRLGLHEKHPARTHFQIYSTNIWQLHSIMDSWHLACSDIPHSVASNPVTYIFGLNWHTYLLFIRPFSWNSDTYSMVFSRRIPIRPGHIPCDVQNKAYICIFVCCVLFSSIRWRKVWVTSVSYRQARSW